MDFQLIFVTLLLGLPLTINGKHHNRPRRMVRGDLAEAIYPYQISLQVNLIFAWFNFCGGSIVTERHAVTAAHCLHVYKPTSLSVWAGSTKLNGEGQRYMVEKLLIHHAYTNDKKHNPKLSDIGIITIKGSFSFSETIKPIGYNAEDVGGGIVCVTTGWGSTNTTKAEEFPNDLRRIESVTMTHNECAEIWREAIDTINICAEPKAGQGICSGDSGSPLAKDNQLIGITSFGHEVCGDSKPDVYTRVSKFYQWIKDNTN